MDPGSKPLRVSVTDGRGRPLRDGGLGRWLARVAPRAARGEVAIALVTDARMRVLNRTHRRKDCATDVLAFEGPWVLRSVRPRVRGSRGPEILGDLVIAKGVAERQAREAGHSYQAELRVLALHGLLHLLGYDHDNPDDSGSMVRAEARLRKKGGLKAGLIERAPATRKRAGVGPRGPSS